MFDGRAPILLLIVIPLLAQSAAVAEPTTAPAPNLVDALRDLRREAAERIQEAIPQPPANAPEPQAQPPEPEAAPTTLPSQAAGKPASEKDLADWFNDLAASDAVVRDRAYAAMLGLTRADLPALRRIVERAKPIAPSQRGPLREIVTHVYLSGEPYPAEPRAGFLGLLIPTLESVDVRRDDAPDQPAPAPPPPGLINIVDLAGGVMPVVASTGVPIEYRIPGFCAFRALREGDVILSIVRPVPRRLREWGDLSPTVRRYRAGDTLTFEVLRQGKLLEVPITLDALPLVATENAWMTDILPARESAAADYWATNFAPLVEEHSSASITLPDQHASL